jgi:hypothetical protein
MFNVDIEGEAGGQGYWPEERVTGKPRGLAVTHNLPSLKFYSLHLRGVVVFV